MNLKSEYRRNQQNFKTLPAITNLNKKLHDNVKINNKTVSINVKDNNLNKWKDEMSVSVDDIPFENIVVLIEKTVNYEN